MQFFLDPIIIISTWCDNFKCMMMHHGLENLKKILFGWPDVVLEEITVCAYKYKQQLNWMTIIGFLYQVETVSSINLVFRFFIWIDMKLERKIIKINFEGRIFFWNYTQICLNNKNISKSDEKIINQNFCCFSSLNERNRVLMCIRI